MIYGISTGRPFVEDAVQSIISRARSGLRLLAFVRYRSIHPAAGGVHKARDGGRRDIGGRGGVSVFRQGADRPETLYDIAIEVAGTAAALSPSGLPRPTSFTAAGDNSCSGLWPTVK